MYVNKKFQYPINFLMNMREFNHLKSSQLSNTQMEGFNYIMDNELTEIEKTVVISRFKDLLSESKTTEIVSSITGQKATRHDIDLILNRVMRKFSLNKNYILGNGHLNMTVSDDCTTLLISYSY